MLNNSDLINQDDQQRINEMDVEGAEMAICEMHRVCDPEAFFDIVEICKMCGRCV
jgi:hypothetical protein